MILIYLAIVNLVALILYGIDKWRAVHQEWRISEATLLIIAAIGGSVGAWLGMQLFRHKTKHLKFRIGIPVMFILQLVLVYLIYTSLTSYLN